jgi:serine protease Do
MRFHIAVGPGETGCTQDTRFTDSAALSRGKTPFSFPNAKGGNFNMDSRLDSDKERARRTGIWRYAATWLLPATLLMAGAGCSVSKHPTPPDKVLVSKEDPIFDRRFENIGFEDVNLEQFWTELPRRGQPEAIPITNKTVADLVDAVKDSVVNIYTSRLEEHEARFGIAPNDLMPIRIPVISSILEIIPFQVPIPFSAQGVSLGSGFIINEQGYILTNAHVIQNATEIRVALAEGKKQYAAKIIGADPLTDCALIKIDTGMPLKPLPLGNSDTLRVGEMVIAVGNPMGLTHTVSAGMVSAKERIVPRLKDQLLDFVQTDSAINPGSSGGPLINLYGEAVGINTAIIPDAQLIGFATPIEIAKTVMPMLVLGKTERGALGISARPVNARDTLETELRNGIVVIDVEEGSPAEKIGVQKNDIITHVDGVEIVNFLRFRRTLLGLTPNRRIELTLFRNGKTSTVTSALAAAKKPE